jgi:hypothetical protein
VWLDKCTYCRFGDFSIKYVLAEVWLSGQKVALVALSPFLLLRSFGVDGLFQKVHFLPNCDFGHFGF